MFCGSDSGLCAGVLCLVVVGRALRGVEGLLLARGGSCLEGGMLMNKTHKVPAHRAYNWMEGMEGEK